jgi:hypothetical protein
MLKILGRIILVILIAALFSAGIYYLLNIGPSQSQASIVGGNPPSLSSENNQHDRQGGFGTGADRPGKGDLALSGAAWLDVLKNLLLISTFTIVIALFQKVLLPKPRVEEMSEID